MTQSVVAFVASIVLLASVLPTLCVGKQQEEAKLKLDKVIVLNRHGHRAPNGPYWDACPHDKANRKKYDVLDEDLSGLGMQEEFQFGKFLRSRYSDLIGPNYDRRKFFIRAVGVPRCMQSAMAISQAIFPSGFGPRGFLPGRPQFVSVFSDLDIHEYLVDDTPCWGRSALDQKDWYRDTFPVYMKDPLVSSAIDELIKLCGSAYPQTDDEMALFVKLVVDGVVFNSDYGLEVLGGRIDKKLMFQLRNISILLLRGRLFATDAQQTYGVMDFPSQLLLAAREPYSLAAYDEFVHPLQQVQVYVGHREELYGFDEFFGIATQVADLPPNELPVASSYLFEILRQEDLVNQRNQTYIKVTLWTPTSGEYSVAIPGCNSPRLCTVEELSALVDARNARTGPWRKICNYETI